MAALSALAARAVPYLIDNAPALLKAANQLIGSARKAKAEIPVEAAEAAAAGSGEALEAAIRDIETSLLALNAQMEKGAELTAGLAEQNLALTERVRKLEAEARTAWMAGLAGLVAGLAALVVALLR